MTDIVRPTRPGQAVRDIHTGSIGITTDEPMSRSPRIGVMMVGAFYPIAAQLEDLEVLEGTLAVIPAEPTAAEEAEHDDEVERSIAEHEQAIAVEPDGLDLMTMPGAIDGDGVRHEADEPKMIPVPWASTRTRERNENLKPLDDVCLFCLAPMADNTPGTWLVHMSTGGELFPAGDYFQHPDSQGAFPVGAACAKKVPVAYRVKASHL